MLWPAVQARARSPARCQARPSVSDIAATTPAQPGGAAAGRGFASLLGCHRSSSPTRPGLCCVRANSAKISAAPGRRRRHTVMAQRAWRLKLFSSCSSAGSPACGRPVVPSRGRCWSRVVPEESAQLGRRSGEAARSRRHAARSVRSARRAGGHGKRSGLVCRRDLCSRARRLCVRRPHMPRAAPARLSISSAPQISRHSGRVMAQM